MKVAFVIFNRMTALDFVGAYDPVTRLKSMKLMPEMSWDICAYSEEVADDRGLAFTPTKVGEPLRNYELLIVPGGFGTRELVGDAPFIEWLGTAAPCGLKASVCTGSLLLGAAGFLEGRRATTHPNAFRELARYCARVEDRRVVDEGDVVTAGGVTSAIDLGLHLVGRLAGREGRERIRKQMDYRAAGAT
jgi:transcriptional regulator GlxA family with amidase domain